MNPFRFRLQKVLELRKTQLELEEAKFKRETAALADLDRMRAALEAAGTNAEMQVRRLASLTGSDLAALGAFRLQVKAQQAEIARLRMERVALVAAQQKAMLEARRRCRLLERLKERRLDEWQAAANKELDELAAESYIAQWHGK
jgi:hypothetical protein